MDKGSELNYIRLLNTFNNIARSKGISPYATLLYYKVLDIWNSAGRPKEVAITNQRLIVELQLNSDKPLYKLRKELEQEHIIGYIRGFKGVPGKYIVLDMRKQKRQELQAKRRKSRQKRLTQTLIWNNPDGI